MGLALKAIVELAQQNVTQVVQSMGLASSEHWKRLVEQALWTGA